MGDVELILERKLNRSTWTLHEFSELVANISEKVVPKQSNLSTYIGLEHLDSGTLHIDRYGDSNTLEGDKLKIYKGDIIFAKRNAYLKRVALAPFDSIASAHSLVLRIKKENVFDKFLPYFLLSESFWKRAIEISVGSLSPTINWKSIASQKFPLPPIEDQRWLAEIFESLDKLIQSEKQLVQRLSKAYEVQRKDLIEHGPHREYESRTLRFGKVAKEWEVKELNEFCKFVGGGAFQSHRFKSEGKHQVLRIGNLTETGLNLDKQPVFIEDLQETDKKYFAPKGAIIVSLTGTNGKRDYGFPYLMKDNEEFLLNQRLAMILVNEEIMLPEFLHLLSKMELFQGRFFLNATGSANQANVSMGDIGEIQLPVPPISEQRIILRKLNYISETLASAELQLSMANQSFYSLINKVF